MKFVLIMIYAWSRVTFSETVEFGSLEACEAARAAILEDVDDFQHIKCHPKDARLSKLEGKE